MIKPDLSSAIIPEKELVKKQLAMAGQAESKLKTTTDKPRATII